MSNYDHNVVIPGAPVDQKFAVDAGLRAHMLQVYNYMATGVGLTGLVAMLTYQFTGPELLQSPLMWVFMLAPFAPVFFISARINKLSAETARLLFFVYAALVGLSLSTIFHVYTGASITRVFFISAATFGAVSIWGYTRSATCRDSARSFGRDRLLRSTGRRRSLPVHPPAKSPSERRKSSPARSNDVGGGVCRR